MYVLIYNLLCVTEKAKKCKQKNLFSNFVLINSVYTPIINNYNNYKNL